MHLGRPPTAIPEDLRARRDELGPEAAWFRSVDEAIARKVDAVLLAGDLVDQGRDFFVAYGQLKAGIERLTEAGIRVLAVAGNHDTEVLPRLAGEIDQLELVGAGGQWQSVPVDGITLLGWSFPRPQVRNSPLGDLPASQGKGTVVGLLHCDVDQADSPHAPVSRRELEAAPVNAWLLGHIHRPDDLDSDRPIGYLGSISALRASETGRRGPWLVQIEGKDIAADQLPLAALRYEALEIDCSELEDAGELGAKVLAATRERLRTLADSDNQPKAVGLRITLTGQSPAAAALGEAAAELAADGRSWEEQGIACFVHRIESTVMPRLDLRRLARQSDPCGLLARRLLALQDPEDEEYQRLVRLARESMSPVLGAREFRDLDREPDDEAIAGWLRRAGRMALIRLVAQREEAG
ncbi:DNA repair exonuclease [Wenzhouxiangella sediminis]|uniref:DNA repair exonuclease n=2 Tax=Wenzhouxiangella sediminis TaxID=1792836 RepID=A0A3E1K9W9_9GAMM|nr:DNA repair exonuclease [Wenzhouxiangella sediminis]